VSTFEGKPVGFIVFTSKIARARLDVRRLELQTTLTGSIEHVRVTSVSQSAPLYGHSSALMHVCVCTGGEECSLHLGQLQEPADPLYMHLSDVTLNPNPSKCMYIP
jgi:hypothetical protein